MKLVVALVVALSAVVGQAAEPASPDDVRQELQSLVGTWKPDAQNWEGKYTVEWITPGQYCLLARGKVWPKGQPDESMGFYSIYGWDADAKEIIDAGFFSNGKSRVFHWKTTAPGEWKHTAREGGTPDATLKLEKDKTTFKGADFDGNPITIVATRVERLSAKP